MSLYLVGEARIVEKREVNTKNGDSWIEIKMNVEHQKGYYQLYLTKSLNTEENIKFLDSLKGKKINIPVYVVSNDKGYLKYYIAELPKAI